MRTTANFVGQRSSLIENKARVQKFLMTDHVGTLDHHLRMTESCLLQFLNNRTS
jgi:hypothetical protein